ncbi:MULTISPECIES: heme exporter protein CcmD [unclassified Thalassotalea]|uniref:heme exporter protein CcmD n=1 Tax=unclassified Thalassotalea TaxID=2614972 RepID=UPI001081CBF0|nr:MULTISPECIES: heme exporter protein CcmD [unclassified Thalassotalea]NMP15843.1 heme exporter protein CcmD [Thalassotalea sp. Y01]QBY04887.1 heme exporter protein CcmD [Thalassotalea sp. HSM 43]
MAFDSISEFFNMGGYGFYVWLSYAFCAVLLTALTINSMGMQNALFKKIKQRLKREAKLKQAAERRKQGM